MTSPDRDLPMDLNVQFEVTGEMWPWHGWGVIPAGARIGG